MLVTGNAGSGKTTLSLRLGESLALPVIHLDRVVWRPGWRYAEKGEIARALDELTARESWVIDGVSSQALEAADTIVFLDFPRCTCLKRALARTVRHLFRQRPELPADCPELRVVWAMLKIIWRYPTETRPRLTAYLAKSAPHKNVVWIRNLNDLARLSEGLATDRGRIMT